MRIDKRKHTIHHFAAIRLISSHVLFNYRISIFHGIFISSWQISPLVRPIISNQIYRTIFFVITKQRNLQSFWTSSISIAIIYPHLLHSIMYITNLGITILNYKLRFIAFAYRLFYIVFTRNSPVKQILKLCVRLYYRIITSWNSTTHYVFVYTFFVSFTKFIKSNSLFREVIWPSQSKGKSVIFQSFLSYTRNLLTNLKRSRQTTIIYYCQRFTGIIPNILIATSLLKLTSLRISVHERRRISIR